MDNQNNRDKKCIYLDYNGTTPIYPPVLDAMLPYLTEHYGNPSSSHYYGHAPKLAVNSARRSILRLIQSHNTSDADVSSNAISEEEDLSSIIFTGCGTESNNLAIRLALLSSQHKADANGILHVISSNIEHPAITQCLNSYTEDGNLTPRISITYIPVNEEGIVSIQNVISAIRPNTVLVTIMTANNEVGSIQPVFDITKICRERQILFHTDAAQAVGKIDLRSLAHPTHGADFVTIVGHKFGAPKGIAALYIRPNCFNEDGRIDPESGGSVLLMGGGQEAGRRGGTENVPYIVGIATAANMLFEKKQSSLNADDTVDGWRYNSQHMASLRERLLQNLERGLGEVGDTTIVRTNGPLNPDQRLPNTLSVGIKGIWSGETLANIGNLVACSAGSACHSCSQTMSYSSILKAMNVPPEYALGTLRLSVGPDTTTDDIDLAAEIIVKEAKRQLENKKDSNS